MIRPSALIALASLILAGCAARPASPPTEKSTVSAPVAVRFEDVTPASGLSFKHFTGADGRYLMPESVGPGGAFLDYDRDGWLDILCVNGTSWTDRGGPQKGPSLFRNQQDGTFRDVTRAAGLGLSAYGMGCAIGDYDGDGWDDILLTCLGPNRLLRNERGRFVDATSQSGLTADRWDWHTGAAWVDYDRDGRLDLFVCRYVKWTPATDIRCDSGAGERTYCGPNQYQPVSSKLYRNVGGAFRDVSKATGVEAANGKGLGVLPVDEDGDGWVDLMVSNDTAPNHFFRNVPGEGAGERKFTEMALELGVAVSPEGKARAGMGLDVADVRNDGKLHFAIGNFDKEGVALFEQAAGSYTDQARETGAMGPSLRKVTFGLAFLDVDRDGWQDLFAYNGHVSPLAADSGDGAVFKQTPLLLRNERGRFRPHETQAGDPLSVPQVGRGCATGDYDNDGRPDLLLFENAGPARLLRNVSPDRNHWLGVRLLGKGKNRNAFGAEIAVTVGGMTQRRWVRSGGSYLCESDHRALFGLGPASTVERLDVRWPSGERSTVTPEGIDRYLDVPEP